MTFQERVRECKCELFVIMHAIHYHDRPETDPTAVHDPILDLAGAEEDFVWLLEQHSTLYPYDRNQAQRSTSMVENYGASLARQLDVAGIFSGFESLLEEMDVVVVNIRDNGKRSLLHKLHWEVLETSCPHDRPYMPRLLVRRLVSPDNSQKVVGGDESLGSAKRHWNILMVVARPDKNDDIDPLLGTRALCQVSTMMEKSRAFLSKADVDFCSPVTTSEVQKHLKSYDIDFEVARPGSWIALKEMLRVRTEAWHESGGHGAWFDLVHFDVHGALWNGEAHLVFSSATGQNALWKSASKIGKLLKRYHIPHVLLNSCNSAKVTSNHLSNLARTVVEAGVRTVIAMSFKFTSSAANLFNVAFYLRLFRTPSPPDVLSALMAARGVLWRITKRTGRMGQTVEIPDHIVPVIYVGAAHSSACLPWRRLSGEPYKVLSDLENATTSTMATLVAEQWAARSPLFDSGRQQEIVELEWLLLKTHKSNVALMTGMVDTGKTLLLRLLASWWTATAFVESCRYVCARSNGFEKITSILEELREESATSLTGKRRLLIIDHLDIATMLSDDGKGEPLSPWTDEQKGTFTSLIQTFVGGPYLLMLVARDREAYLGVPASQVYRLGGLAHHHANDLALETFKKGGLQEAIIDEKEKRYIQYLTSRLLYNPLAIIFFVEGMIAGLKNFPQYPWLPDRPSRLFDWLTTSATNGSVYYDQEKSPIARECFLFICNLCEGNTVASKKRRSIILSLAPCNSVFHREWIDRLMPENHDKLPPDDSRRKVIPTRAEFHGFLDSVLLKSGWMEDFDLPLPEGKVDRYIHIHPVFTNIVRTLPSMGEGKYWQDLPKSVSYVFGNYNYERIQRFLLVDGEIQDIVEVPGTEKHRAIVGWESLGRETILRIQVEAANYLQGAMQLIQEKDYTDAKAILLVLWEVAIRSRTPALSVEMLLVCITHFRLTLRQTLAGSVNNEGDSYHQMALAIAELSKRLSRFYMQTKPKLAKGFAEDALWLAFQYGGEIISWRASSLIQIVMLLITYGISLLQLGKHFHQAQEAFITALRLSHCHQITPLIAFAASFGLEQAGIIRGTDEESRQILGEVQTTALLFMSTRDEHRARNRGIIDLG